MSSNSLAHSCKANGALDVGSLKRPSGEELLQYVT